MLEAERFSLLGKDAEAYEKYVVAIAVAMDSGFLLVQGVANERAARHLIQTGKRELALKFFRASSAAFEEWGAQAKVRQLQEDLGLLYPADDSCFFDT